MISRDYFSQSDQFDTSDWTAMWDITLTLKQAFKRKDCREIYTSIDEYQSRRAFHHFMNLLNRAVYGNAYRRNGKRLRVIPILERGDFWIDGVFEKVCYPKRWHYHAAIEPPPHIDADSFKALIEQCWAHVDWGYRRILVRPNADRGWIDYMLKPSQKSGFYVGSDCDWSDCIDWESLHNTSKC
jgi:hypothetical protein